MSGWSRHDRQAEERLRQGIAICDQLGVNMPWSRIRRLAHEYEKRHAISPLSFREWFNSQLHRDAEKRRQERIGEASALVYADPTGEHATTRVHRQATRNSSARGRLTP